MKIIMLSIITFFSTYSIANQHVLCEIGLKQNEDQLKITDYLLISIDTDKRLYRIRATATVKNFTTIRSKDLVEFNYGVEKPEIAKAPYKEYYSGLVGPLIGYSLKNDIYITLPKLLETKIPKEGLLRWDKTEASPLFCRLIDENDVLFKSLF